LTLKAPKRPQKRISAAFQTELVGLRRLDSPRTTPLRPRRGSNGNVRRFSSEFIRAKRASSAMHLQIHGKF
jgi:hypothetical protein